MDPNHGSGTGTPYPSLQPEGGPGIVERFIQIFTAPAEAFRPPRTAALWLVPLALLILLSATQSLLLRDLALETQRARIASSDFPEEQKETILKSMEPGAGGPLGRSLQILLGGVGSLIFFYFLPALLYMLGLNFGLGARTRYGQVLGVTLFTALLHFVREIIRLPIMLGKQTLHVYTGPAALVDPDNRVLLAVLQRFDLFDLYRLFLLAVGFAVITAMPARRTAVPVIAVWLLATVAFVGFQASPLGQFTP